jgi:hypothetical protein
LSLFIGSGNAQYLIIKKGFTMGKTPNETPALLIIDMVKDNFAESRHLPITPFARALIQPLNKTIDVFRSQKWPIVFSTDAFHEDDFIFQARMQPHSLAGTKGAEVFVPWAALPRIFVFYRPFWMQSATILRPFCLKIVRHHIQNRFTGKLWTHTDAIPFILCCG